MNTEHAKTISQEFGMAIQKSVESGKSDLPEAQVCLMYQITEHINNL